MSIGSSGVECWVYLFSFFFRKFGPKIIIFGVQNSVKLPSEKSVTAPAQMCSCTLHVYMYTGEDCNPLVASANATTFFLYVHVCTLLFIQCWWL